MPRDMLHVGGVTIKITPKQIEFYDHKTGKRTRWRSKPPIPRTPIIYKKGDMTFSFLGAGKIKDVPDTIVLIGKVGEQIGKTISA